jgi:hypothetical protein
VSPDTVPRNFFSGWSPYGTTVKVSPAYLLQTRST